MKHTELRQSLYDSKKLKYYASISDSNGNCKARILRDDFETPKEAHEFSTELIERFNNHEKLVECLGKVLLEANAARASLFIHNELRENEVISRSMAEAQSLLTTLNQ